MALEATSEDREMTENSFVFIRNKNKDSHKDSYNGIEYVFAPNKKVPVPLPAAEHMFAYGHEEEEAKRKAVARVGKDRSYEQDVTGKVQIIDTMAEGLIWLEKFEIKPGKFVPVDDEGDTGDTGSTSDLK